jgi:hypothetical protein
VGRQQGRQQLQRPVMQGRRVCSSAGASGTSWLHSMLAGEFMLPAHPCGHRFSHYWKSGTVLGAVKSGGEHHT